MTGPSYGRDDLVRQPIGYWSGEAYRRVADGIRAGLAANGLSQPGWWILNRLADASRSWTPAGLVEELAPYSDREEGRDVADELERLLAAGLAAVDGDTVAITAAGTERLLAARERNGRTHRAMREGISDDEYATTIDVLRRIVGNLGGDPRLP
ncbi:MarR family transcriptional regulator [Pseudonocardia humida]|uniref:MarR family transcriptional regulator n=1 Tax=Pseudonocardia humida TaxID=2800819 RepID=A0ABT0ZZZ0_9PSEU|nr:MarR family transcriptional regulator [Pseudonocardia humida]MCO1656286.1 MarR family transcriptional regulator [Pseudonocardia humida]